jgi:hypothetical protein
MAMLATFRRHNAHVWGPHPRSFCIGCGILNPLEEAYNRDLYDPEDGFAVTPEGEREEWRVARINIFGCAVNHSQHVH